MNSYPAIGRHATANYYVDQNFNFDDLTLVRNEKIRTLSIFLSNILQIPVNSEPTDDNRAATKCFVDSLSENDRNRRNMSIVFDDQGNKVYKNKITKLDSFTFNWNPLLDEEVSKKCWGWI